MFLALTRHYPLVRLVHVLHGQNRQVAVVPKVPEGKPGAGFNTKRFNRSLARIEGNRHAEEDAIDEAILLDNARSRMLALGLVGDRHVRACDIPIVVLLVHEA